jgi:hypothetical protein
MAGLQAYERAFGCPALFDQPTTSADVLRSQFEQRFDFEASPERAMTRALSPLLLLRRGRQKLLQFRMEAVRLVDLDEVIGVVDAHEFPVRKIRTGERRVVMGVTC